MAFHPRRFLPTTAELHKALWLGAVLSAITCSYTLVKVARDALFLSRLPAQKLPFVYMLVGVITLAVSWAFGRATHRLSPLRTLLLSGLVSALALVGFALGFATNQSWVPVAFYVWVNVYGLILTSQFWIFTNSRTDPSEAKRIFGIIGGGGILGGLVGGIATARLGHRVPLSGFALAGAALLIAMVLVMTIAVRQGQMPAGEEIGGDGEPPPLTRAPYVRWLAIATLCSVVATGVIDYEFKVVAQGLYPDEAGLASFFGRIFVVVNVAALALQLLGTSWLLQRFGATAVAGILPTGLAVGATATIVAPGFTSVVGTRLWDQVVRFSLNKSTNELFYFPLEARLRRRAKALIEAGIERFGDALAGLIIAVTGAFLVVGPVELSSILAVLVVVWLVAWARLGGGYVRELGRSLRRMNPGAEQDRVSLRERSVLKELVRALDGPHERVVLQAMNMLLDSAPPLLDARLPKLLEHRSSVVRARALERAHEHPTPEAREAAARRMRDPDPRVRVQAMRLHCSLREGGTMESLNAFLADDDPELRATALACLVERAGPEDVPRVKQWLEPLLHSFDPAQRAVAAAALGGLRAPHELLELLLPLLDDPDESVRRAALRSVGGARWQQRLPALIEALASRATEEAATDALLEFGDEAVGPLGRALASPREALEVRRVIPRVLARIPTQASVDALFRAPAGEDILLDYRVVKAANEIRQARPGLSLPASRIEENLDRDIREFLAAELHADILHDAPDEPGQFLLRVLHERRDQAFNRVFRHLALLYPPRAMFSAYHGLQSHNTRMRGSAVEYVASVLVPEHRAWVVPLLPNATAEARRELMETRYALVPVSPREAMAALLESPDQWLRACAMYVVGRRADRGFLRLVEAGLDARDPRVRETAQWAKDAMIGAAA